MCIISFPCELNADYIMKYQIVFVIYDKILKDCIFLLTDNYHNQQNLYIYQDKKNFQYDDWTKDYSNPKKNIC